MSQVTNELLAKLAWTAVQSACEWDDRTSPDGYEDYMFLKPDELHQVLVSFFETALSTPPVEAETGEPVAWRWQTNYTDDTWHYAEKVSFAHRDIELGIVKNVTPLFAAPPRSDKANGEAAANIADRILRRVRAFIVAEHKHARLLESRETELATSRDDADHEHAELVGFTVEQVDQALRIVRRRLPLSTSPAVPREDAREAAIGDAFDFVMSKLVAMNREKGPAGVWSAGFRSGWDAAARASLVSQEAGE